MAPPLPFTFYLHPLVVKAYAFARDFKKLEACVSRFQQYFSLSPLDRGSEVHAGDEQVVAPSCFKENFFRLKSHLSPVLSGP
jgi:hypothetical protein